MWFAVQRCIIESCVCCVVRDETCVTTSKEYKTPPTTRGDWKDQVNYLYRIYALRKKA